MHSSEEQPSDPEPAEQKPRRRGFLAFVVGAVVSLAAVVPGVGVLLDPWLRKKKSGGRFVRITTLDALPPDGLPHRFQVVTERFDKWNKYPPEPIDAVYLVRSDATSLPVAFSVICPHLGCAVDFKPDAGEFQCPCHTSGFALDGAAKYGPSPRPLDTLAVELRRQGEVIELASGAEVPKGVELWIDYKKFKVGKTEKNEA